MRTVGKSRALHSGRCGVACCGTSGNFMARYRGEICSIHRQNWFAAPKPPLCASVRRRGYCNNSRKTPWKACALQNIEREDGWGRLYILPLRQRCVAYKDRSCGVSGKADMRDLEIEDYFRKVMIGSHNMVEV